MPMRTNTNHLRSCFANYAHAVEFNGGRGGEDRSAGFLAVYAVAGVAEEGRGFELVADGAAGTAAVDDGEGACWGHG